MEIIRAIIIGAIQGISEFFPVSSSGHLVLIPYIFKWDYNGLSFDVALHFGTVLALIVFFWKDWKDIIKLAVSPAFRFAEAGAPVSPSVNTVRVDRRLAVSLTPNSQPQTTKYPSNFLWQIIVATLPAAIIGYLANDYIDQAFHSSSKLGMLVIALNLAFFGLILWAVDKYSKNNKNPGKISYPHTLAIGFAQALALVPGVSRSGITITASRLMGLKREDAARISFLLATPAMLGAFLLKAKDIGAHDLNLIFILGIISSSVFSFWAIKYLLNYLKKGNFSIFVWYRIAIAIVVLGIYLAR